MAVLTIWDNSRKGVMGVTTSTKEAVSHLKSIDSSNCIVISDGELLGTAQEFIDSNTVKTSECPECFYPHEVSGDTCNIICDKCGARFQ